MEYLITFSISLFFTYLLSKSNNKYLSTMLFLLAIIFPSLLLGLRDVSVGTDNAQYAYFFSKISNWNSPLSATIFGPQEPLYNLLTWVISRFTSDYHWVCFIIGSITTSLIIGGLYKFRHKADMTLGLFIYFMSQFCRNINLMRQGLALAICFYALSYILEKKLIKYIIFIIIATMFHSSSIVAISIYFFYWYTNKQNSIPRVLLCIAICLFTIYNLDYIINYASSMSIVASKYSRYHRIGWGLDFRDTVVRLPILVIASVIFLLIAKRNETYRSLYVMFWLEIILVQLSSITGMPSAERISFAFAYPTFIAISMFKKGRFSKSFRTMIVFFIILYFFVYWFYFTVLNGYGGTRPMYPYKSDILDIGM